MRAVFLSVAHSHLARGAENARLSLTEYDVSLRATDAACAVLRQRSCPVVVLDSAHNPTTTYDDIKIAAARALNPSLAVEIHCNANKDKRANYGEVIHRAGDPVALRAAVTVSDHLRDALGSTRHLWPWRGARIDERNLFFVQKTSCPALIVEGLFLSNDEQAEWLASPGGAEAYGALVGEGIALFIEREHL